MANISNFSYMSTEEMKEDREDFKALVEKWLHQKERERHEVRESKACWEREVDMLRKKNRDLEVNKEVMEEVLKRTRQNAQVRAIAYAELSKEYTKLKNNNEG